MRTRHTALPLPLRHALLRLATALPTLGVVALLSFALMQLTAGDPTALLAGDWATPEDLQQLRRQRGLDLPLWQQFGHWLLQLARGDLGDSLFSGLPVRTLIAQRWAPRPPSPPSRC